MATNAPTTNSTKNSSDSVRNAPRARPANAGQRCATHMPSTVGMPSSTTIVPKTSHGLSVTEWRIGRVAGLSSPQNDRLNGVKTVSPSIENAAMVTDSAVLPRA